MSEISYTVISSRKTYSSSTKNYLSRLQTSVWPKSSARSLSPQHCMSCSLTQHIPLANPAPAAALPPMSPQKSSSPPTTAVTPAPSTSGPSASSSTSVSADFLPSPMSSTHPTIPTHSPTKSSLGASTIPHPIGILYPTPHSTLSTACSPSTSTHASLSMSASSTRG